MVAALSEMFQSHAGSIEARMDMGAEISGASGFNPTLVRLRPPPWPWLRAVFSCFNPTLVRLRLMNISHSPSRMKCFNPTLVRLRRRSHHPPC